MDNTLLTNHLKEILADIGLPVNPQYPEAVVPREKYHDFCMSLKTKQDLLFDYLISLTAVDWNDHFMLVCHITSTRYQHTLVVKTRLDDRDNPVVDTISDIWKTAEYHEREVFDLFGIRFMNHPDLRRLFLDDDWGHPLRKDFSDESRMIVK